MAIQTINIGNSANDGNGEPARSAFNKVNQNFTNNAHAASRMVGVEAGNVMEVGEFGIGKTGGSNTFYSNINISNIPAGCYSVSPTATGSPGANGAGNLFAFGSANYQVQFHKQNIENGLSIRFGEGLNLFSSWGKILINGINTATDGNGFIKAASPIVKLFADKVEPNNEAAEQNITFKKIDIGHYLIQGSSGFALEGWYIETPKDANGNILFAVNYEQLENGDIEVKTYKKKFDLESASIVADLENPVDITLNRWIDVRLQEVPKPVPEMPTEEVNSDEPQQ